MPRFKLTLEYDGAPFVGWQRQKNGVSVQARLEDAVFAMTGERVAAQGAGRTDAGVHALGQVAHVDLLRDWAPFRLAEGINAHLVPDPVAIIKAEAAPQDFDARRSATARRYLYRIVNRRAPLALDFGRAWFVKPRLDVDAMREGARALIGRHDFTTFRDSQCQANSPVRPLDQLDVLRDGAVVTVEARARSFLHRQVRSMVGSLVEASAGRRAPLCRAGSMTRPRRSATPAGGPVKKTASSILTRPKPRSDERSGSPRAQARRSRRAGSPRSPVQEPPRPRCARPETRSSPRSPAGRPRAPRQIRRPSLERCTSRHDSRT